MLTKTLLFLFTIILLTSCGGKEETSSVHLKIFQSSLTSSSNALVGGVLLMGKSEDGKESFRMGLASTSESITLDLAKGRWEFAAVAWSGANGPLTGDNRCAYTEMVDLKDAESSITFNLSTSRCLTNFNGRQFSHSSYMTSDGKFLEFFPVMCLNNTINSAACSIGTNTSKILSYKIIYKGDNEGAIAGSFPSLSSSCLLMNSTVRARIPVTDSQTDSPFNVTLVFYTDSNCSVSPVTYDFEDGLRNNALPIWNSLAAVAPYYTYFYLNPGTMYDSATAEPNGFALTSLVGAGVAGDYNLSYSISSHPSTALEMCFTINSSCLATDWRPLANSGNITIGGVPDGAYVMKLFYKTAAGAISANPYMQSFTLDITPPLAPVGVTVTASVSTGLHLNWGYAESSSFNAWLIETCYDASCSTISSSRSTGNLEDISFVILPYQITGGISLGVNICAKISMMDMFGRSTPFIQCVTPTN